MIVVTKQGIYTISVNDNAKRDDPQICEVGCYSTDCADALIKRFDLSAEGKRISYIRGDLFPCVIFLTMPQVIDLVKEGMDDAYGIECLVVLGESDNQRVETTASEIRDYLWPFGDEPEEEVALKEWLDSKAKEILVR